uniref:Uncharacterized protein n=1 Tax=Pseudomonas phage Nican01 TaxID=3138540 RepID=A0AAU6W1F0_9CAUD
MSQSHATRAHRHALATDARMYATCARNALFELRYAKRSQRYYLHVTNSVSVIIDVNTAHAVYAAMMRHVVRTTAKDERATSVRSSVYTMRSDIRAIVRILMHMNYAH